MHTDFAYVDCALGALNQRSNVLLLEEYNQILKSNNLGSSTSLSNYFRSWFRFPKSYLLSWQAKEKSSVKGYDGEHILDFMFWDLDGGNLETSTSNLFKVLDHLATFGLTLEHYQVWFSGVKGYHVKLAAGCFRPEPHVLLNKIAKKFSELLFPTGWIGPKGLIDSSNFEINRMCRQGGTLNRKDDDKWKEQAGFKVMLTAEHLVELRQEHRVIQEISKAPSSLGLEDLSGLSYWKITAQPRLVELWQQAEKELTESKHGQRIEVKSNGYHATGATEIPQCIGNMLRALNQGKVGPGLRNNTFFIVAAYLKRLMDESVLLSTLLAYNQKLPEPLPEHEIATIVRQVATGTYGTGCGNFESANGAVCLSYCSEAGTKTQCPRFKREHTDEGQVWFMAKEAYNNFWSEMKAGMWPYRFYVPAWDEYSNGVMLDSVVVFQGHTGLGKTAQFIRLMRKNIVTAKERSEIIAVGSPEQQPSLLAGLTLQTLLKQPMSYISHAAGNGGIDPKISNWFELYNDNLALVDTSYFNADDLERYIDQIEQSKGKKLSMFFLDGVIFLDSDQEKSEKSVMKKLMRTCRKHKTIGVFAVHYGKKQIQNNGHKLENFREFEGSAIDGFGTALTGIGGDFIFSLYFKNGVMYASMKKGRIPFEGADLPEDIAWYLDKKSYTPYLEEEVRQALLQGKRLLTGQAYEVFAASQVRQQNGVRL